MVKGRPNNFYRHGKKDGVFVFQDPKEKMGKFMNPVHGSCQI